MSLSGSNRRKTAPAIPPPAKPTTAEDAFWQRQRTSAEGGFDRRKKLGFFDVGAQIKEGTCLNAAEMIHGVALELLLVNLDGQARQSFSAVRKLALAAVKTGELGYYSDAAFAKYMAMRMASTAVWILGGDRLNYFEKMLHFLHEHIRVATRKPGVLDEPRAAGRLALHYGQAGRWLDILNLPKLQPGGDASAALWRSLFSAIFLLAQSKVASTDERAARRAKKALDEWFTVHTNFQQFERSWNPELTSNDILSVAEIRAESVYGVRDPWRIAGSIRWPDFPSKESEPVRS